MWHNVIEDAYVCRLTGRVHLCGPRCTHPVQVDDGIYYCMLTDKEVWPGS